MTFRRTALVTGASRGIGAAVARSPAETHDLLLGGRDDDTMRSLTAELPGARPWKAELTDHEAVATATADIERLDVLVHSAGLIEPAAVADARSVATHV